jgi:glucose-6-phosphate isomerase
MKKTKLELWHAFQQFYREYPAVGLAMDFSRMDFTPEFLAKMEPAVQAALDSMEQLDRGAIANPDEKRMVGHYWLRDSALAPSPEITQEIETTLSDIKCFASLVHSGKIKGVAGAFQNILIVGIGGSALGPQFVSSALGHPKKDKLALYFLDNTDPDGMDRILETLADALGKTLCIVISKSGGTKETRNGLLETKSAYERAGLQFEKHAIAITMNGSELDKYAANWIQRFPMWDWVGGRTSQLSAVGLLPAALQGFDVDSLLAGARAADQTNRSRSTATNPATMLALAWHFAGNGCGEKCMVVLPYKDRLELFSKYLQQLVMESLGKEHDLNGKRVNQGLTVFGNKGATDQHSYIQQLRDGVDNFFSLFVEVLQDRSAVSMDVEPGTTSGDFLHGFFLGTREALYESGRRSVTITVNSVTPFSVGALIALFERAVGIYAALININAYHQPGVQAGKLAADTIIKLKLRIKKHLSENPNTRFTAEQLAIALDLSDQAEHLTANPSRGFSRIAGSTPFNSQYFKH